MDEKTGMKQNEDQGSLLLAWFNFNSNMNKELHPIVEVWELRSDFIPHFTRHGMWLLIHAGIKVNPC